MFETGTIPDISKFIESNSGMKVPDKECLYKPPDTSFMKSDRNIDRSKPNPSRYSRIILTGGGRCANDLIIAPAMIPSPSPATQWIVEPNTRRHLIETYLSCNPGKGSRHPSTYRKAPMGPVYAVTSTN